MDLPTNKIKVKYKILSVNHKDYSMVVRFYTDKIPEDELKGRTDYNISLMKYPSTEEEIHERIRQCAPYHWLRMQQTNTNLDIMVPHIGKEFEYEFKEPEPRKELTEEEIDELLKGL